MNVRATAKFVGTSSRKVGLVAALIRGRKAQDAVTLLTQTPKRATQPVGKVLASAIANAENNYNLKAHDLVVDKVLVGPGATLKRFRPRAQGRAYSIRKRTSHITVVLRNETVNKPQQSAAQQAEPKAVKPSADTKSAAKTTAQAKKPAANAKRKEAK